MSTTAPRTRRRPAFDRVVATANRLFYDRGIQSVGVDQIATEAGISKATMYTYFRTKDELVVRYLEDRSAAWQTHVDAELPGRSPDPRGRILAVFDLLGEWFVAPGYRGCPFVNAEAEFGAAHATHVVTLEHREWVRSLFSELLVTADLPDDLALQLTLLYDGAMVSAQADPSRPWAAIAQSAAASVIGS
jgi:AcrR family transcriptional regulator